MNAGSPAPTTNAPRSARRFAYREYLLVILALVLASNYIDRIAIGIVLQDIKRDLDLSDTQLGLLTGIAFSLFYTIMGFPIARWADRGNRVVIISSTTAIWCAAVAVCGLATSFYQLLAIRVAVAIGEAGCLPTANSLIADHFDRSERPRAVSRLMLGAPLSMVIGYFFAGWLNELYGWRITFILLGLPGLLLALVDAVTLKEPRNDPGATSVRREAALRNVPDVSFWQTIVALCRIRTFRALLVGNSIIAFFATGIGQWKPAFFMRTYGLGSAEVGTWFAIIAGITGIAGALAGGELATRRAAKNERLQLRACAIGYCVIGGASIFLYTSSSPALAFFLLGLTLLGLYATYGPLYAIFQGLASTRSRAVAVSLIYLMSNLVGLGLGPLAAGAISDALRPSFGELSLSFALLALCPGYFIGAIFVWRAAGTVTADLEKAQREDDAAEARLLVLGEAAPRADALPALPSS